MTTTTWVAVAAFCISLSTLIANITVTWLKWPRIVVEVAVRHDGTSEEYASTPGEAPRRTNFPTPTVSMSW